MHRSGASGYHKSIGGLIIVDATGLERVGFMKYPGLEGALVGSSQLSSPVRLGRWQGGTIQSPANISELARELGLKWLPTNLVVG